MRSSVKEVLVSASLRVLSLRRRSSSPTCGVVHQVFGHAFIDGGEIAGHHSTKQLLDHVPGFPAGHPLILPVRASSCERRASEIPWAQRDGAGGIRRSWTAPWSCNRVPELSRLRSAWLTHGFRFHPHTRGSRARLRTCRAVSHAERSTACAMAARTLQPRPPAAAGVGIS